MYISWKKEETVFTFQENKDEYIMHYQGMLTGHNELMSNCHTGKQKVDSLELASSSFDPHVVAFCIKPLAQISYPLKKEKGICTLHLNSTQRCNIEVIIVLYFSSKPKTGPWFSPS